MRRFLAWPIFAMATSCTSVSDVKPPDLHRDVVLRTVLVERVSATVPMDQLLRGPADVFGSGVLLRPDRVLTAAHVVGGARVVRVTVPVPLGDPPVIGSTAVVGRVLSLFPAEDLAVVAIEPVRELPEALLAFTDLTTGEFIYVFDLVPPHPHGIHVGRALGPGGINVSGQPGSSGSGVWSLRDGRFQLGGMVVGHVATAKTVTPIWSQEFGNNRVNVNVVQQQPGVTNVLAASRIRLVTGAGR